MTARNPQYPNNTMKETVPETMQTTFIINRRDRTQSFENEKKKVYIKKKYAAITSNFESISIPSYRQLFSFDNLAVVIDTALSRSRDTQRRENYIAQTANVNWAKQGKEMKQPGHRHQRLKLFWPRGNVFLNMTRHRRKRVKRHKS